MKVAKKNLILIKIKNIKGYLTSAFVLVLRFSHDFEGI